MAFVQVPTQRKVSSERARDGGGGGGGGFQTDAGQPAA